MSSLFKTRDLRGILLIRHATSKRLQDDKWGRLYDAPLVDSFEKELTETRRALSDHQYGDVFSSPLQRCTMTANSLFPTSRIITVEDLRAYHSGRFENSLESDVKKMYPQYATSSYRARFLTPNFGEESIKLQAQRVSLGLETVLSAGQDTAVIVSHFSTINIIAHIALGNLEPDTYADGAFNVEPGGFISISVAVPKIKQNLQRLREGWLFDDRKFGDSRHD